MLAQKTKLRHVGRLRVVQVKLVMRRRGRVPVPVDDVDVRESLRDSGSECRISTAQKLLVISPKSSPASQELRELFAV